MLNNGNKLANPLWSGSPGVLLTHILMREELEYTYIYYNAK